MEQIPQELYQYGAFGIFSIILLKEGVALIKWILSKRNGNGKDNKQDVKLAVIEQRLKTIEENHLPHIEKRLEKIEEKLDTLIKK